jgi:hypothetical protein
VVRAYYSVPPEYLGRKVWVRWDGQPVGGLGERSESGPRWSSMPKSGRGGLPCWSEPDAERGAGVGRWRGRTGDVHDVIVPAIGGSRSERFCWNAGRVVLIERVDLGQP